MMTPESLFPVTLNARWQAPSNFVLDAGIKSWLLDPSSLTARLKLSCQQFRIEVLGQVIQACSASEANEDILVGEQVLVREVLLICNDVPQVFARSLLPLRSLTGEQQALANLGTQSLGQVLFNHPQLQRKKIEIADFSSESSVAKLALALQLPVQQRMWGRRSVLVVEDKPIMVAEVFLPAAFAYQQKEERVCQN